MSLVNFFRIQRIRFVLGGGFPGIYSFRLTDRCWSADGDGVILSTTWRSYKVGISYRLITFLFVNSLAQVCWFLECARLPFNRNKPQIIKIINFETRRRIVNDELEKLLIEFLKRLH